MYSLAQWLAIEPGPKATSCYSRFMSIDNRSWYRDLLRKKSGYVERADFRVSLKDRALENARKRHERLAFPWVKVCLSVLLFVVLLRQLMIYLH